MQFLSFPMLWGLAALAAPIAIHLWQRRRVVQLPFSTLKYLRIVAARTSRSAKLENLSLLLLRCLLFALVALAAARPVINKRALHSLGGNVPRTVVFVLDHSMSMGYKMGGQTRLETARAQALTVLDSLKAGDEVAVFATDDRAEPLVAQPTQDRNVVRQAIEGLRPGWGSTQFAAALIAGRQVLARSPKPVRELYVFTDNQAAGWEFDPKTVFDDAWKKADASLIVIRPDDAPAPNAALAKIEITTPLVTAGERVSGVATVANYSTSALADVVTVKVLGSEVAAVSVEVPAYGSQDVKFDFSLPANVTGKTVRGTASLQGDHLPADDRFSFLVPIHQTPRAVIFEGASAGPKHEHSGFYLRRALAAGMNGGAEPPALPGTALADTDLNAYSVVFLADVSQLSDRAVIQLDNFAQAGGTIVYFPGDATELPALARLDFLPAVAQRMRELPIGRLSSQITDPGNPLFANTWVAGTPFPPLPQHRLIEWKLKTGAQALVLAGGSEAFVISGELGDGKVYLVNASPDRAWGDFPLSPAFLPLVQQIALQSTEHGRTPPGYTVGQAIPASTTLPRDRPLSVEFPDGTRQPLLLGDRATVLDRAPQVGFYQVGTAEDPALFSFAVNAPGQESDLRPITEDALGKIVPHESVAGAENLRLWLAQSRGLVPLWPAVLFLALLVFAAESALSNLAAHIRAQGGESQIKTGRLNKRRVGSPFRAAAVED